MTEQIARRVVDAFEKGGYDCVCRELEICDRSAQCYLSVARKILGITVSRSDWTKIKKASLPEIDFDLAERLWREGKTTEQVDAAIGRLGVIGIARKKFGNQRFPSHAVKKIPRKHLLITGRDLGRHLVRRLGPDEFLIRDENFREEIWKRDPCGIVFGNGLRVSFVIVMGMTERRVPEDLRHLFPSEPTQSPVPASR